MTDPLYKPQYWVRYQQGTTGGYGRIAGASYDNDTWVYSIEGPLLDTTYAGIEESSITALFENGSWLAPRQNGGGSDGGSAYTDTTPSI